MLYFYIAKEHYPSEIPQDRSGLYPNYLIGNYNWTLQTYLALQKIGYPCLLTDEIPEQGIIVSHSINLPKLFVPSQRQLLVCIQADYPRHPHAQIHVVQNPNGLKSNYMRSLDRIFYPGWDFYMRHWPQPQLIPRDPNRGNIFQNICYFGLPENLSAEMKDKGFQQEISSLGLNWHFKDTPKSWNDFSETDVILAVRNFSRSQPQWKPATKLFNAWLAGIPAIVDLDSAYMAEKTCEHDFLRAATAEQVLRHLKLLKEDPELRRKMNDQAKIRAVEFSELKMTESWKNLVENEFIPIFERWKKSKSLRALFYASKKSRPVYNSLKQSIKRLVTVSK